MTYPTREQAIHLWKEILCIRDENPKISRTDEYITHTTNVAKCAEAIAEKCGMDKEKAYVLGLLHDAGKYQKEIATGVFHGRAGYEWMLKLGYTDVAKVCLTHTFLTNPIDRENYNYKKEWLDWADNFLKDIEYDDYDKLIQFADLLSEKFDITTIEARFEGIAQRYNLTEEQKDKATNISLQLKKYFDTKCGCDIYELLGI